MAAIQFPSRSGIRRIVPRHVLSGHVLQDFASGAFHVIETIPGTTYGPLLQANDGTFYGVTEFDGINGAGTVYKISGATYKILHTFHMTTGSYPVGGLVQGSDGNLRHHDGRGPDQCRGALHTHHSDWNLLCAREL